MIALAHPVRIRVPADYLALVKRFPLRQIRDDAHYDAAASVIDTLAIRDEGTLTPGEQDYLDALALLVEAYDREHHDLGPDKRTPVQRLKSLMQSSGMSSSRLGDVIGSRPAASMILQGRRALSKAHVRLLAAHFKMDAGYFL
jgi:HTH-type transcriptional regulator/antitoxin HigA